jgi:hypothetical protein
LVCPGGVKGDEAVHRLHQDLASAVGELRTATA